MELDHGLLLIVGEVPPDFEGRFNEWYDEDHAPARLSVPGIVTARRYKQERLDFRSDSFTQGDRASKHIPGTPSDCVTYLTIYELANLAVLESDEYRALSSSVSSDLEIEVKQVAKFDRRVYRATPTPDSAKAQQVTICGPYLLCVWQSSEADQRWAAVQSHSSGLLRTRRYQLQSGQGADHLTIYDIESREEVDDVIEHESLDAVRKKGKDSGEELRLFCLHRRFDHANPPPSVVNA
jgi:hypothetical protein